MSRDRALAKQRLLLMGSYDWKSASTSFNLVSASIQGFLLEYYSYLNTRPSHATSRAALWTLSWRCRILSSSDHEAIGIPSENRRNSAKFSIGALGKSWNGLKQRSSSAMTNFSSWSSSFRWISIILRLSNQAIRPPTLMGFSYFRNIETSVNWGRYFLVLEFDYYVEPGLESIWLLLSIERTFPPLLLFDHLGLGAKKFVLNVAKGFHHMFGFL